MNFDSMARIPKRWKCMVGLIAALAAAPAYPQHEGGNVYMGVAGGYQFAPDMQGALREELSDTSVSVDDGVFGWSAYGGYFATNGVAIELGHLGTADIDVGNRRGTITGSLSVSAFYAAVAGYFPMSVGSSAFPFVKVGMVRWESDTSITDGPAGRFDEDGTDPLLGVGFDIIRFDGLSFRGEYLLALIDDESGNHHRFQVGLHFTF